jgi:hypothetical protein
LALLIQLCGAASEVRAGNIFEEDWTPPPAPRKPVQPPPPADSSTSKPVIPVDPTPTKPATTPPVIPPEAKTATRRSIPEKAEQARCRKLFKEVFANDLADRSIVARRALGIKLLDEAMKMTDSPTDEFVLLVGATDASREAGDLRVLMRAADKLATLYEVDGARLTLDAIPKMNLRADAPATSTENCRAGLELVNRLVESEDYAGASRLLASLRSLSAPNSTIGLQIQSRNKDVDALRTASEKVARQMDKLKAAPDDPTANFAVGHFLCFMKGDWDRGLAMLAKGSDPVLRALVEKDRAKPTDGAGAYELAGQWWKVAEKEPVPLSKARIRSRAAFWYKQAAPNLSGLSKAMAEKRIDEATVSDAIAQVANETDAPEATAIIEEIAAKYPDLLKDVKQPTLMKYHNAAEIKGGGPYKELAGAYSPKPVICAGGGIVLCRLYEEWPAGKYLIVYRLQSLAPLAGEKVCFIDVCRDGGTVAGKRPDASEFKLGQWVAYPDPITLNETTKLEYRFWPNDHSFCVDRIYIYLLPAKETAK